MLGRSEGYPGDPGPPRSPPRWPQLPAAVECWLLVAQSCPMSRELPSATQKPQGLGGSTSLLSIPGAGSEVSVSPACSKIPPTGRLKWQMLISHSSGGKKSNFKVRVVVTAPSGRAGGHLLDSCPPVAIKLPSPLQGPTFV